MHIRQELLFSELPAFIQAPVSELDLQRYGPSFWGQGSAIDDESMQALRIHSFRQNPDRTDEHQSLSGVDGHLQAINAHSEL